MLTSLLLGCSFYGFGLLVLTIFLLVLKQLVYSLWLFGIFKRNGIPGPKPSLFVGNFYEFRKREDPNQLIEEWLQKYGDVFGYFFGGRAHLVINDVDIIKEIMVRQHRKFRNRAPLSINVLPLCRSLIAAKDDDWKTQRKIITPAFSPSKVRLMTETMNSCVDVFLEEISTLGQRNEDFDIYKRVQALTLEVIAKCALAMDVSCQKNLKDYFFCAVKEYFEFCENAAVKAAIVFPPLAKLLRFLNDNLSAGKLTDGIVENLQKVIHDRRNNDQKRTDLLQLMLDSADESRKLHGSSKQNMDDYCAIANAHFFLLAGYETTATALGFTLYLLAKHQDVQSRLLKDVTEHIGVDGRPTYEDISKMQYLEQVLNESMRLYPPVTLFITRHCQEHCEINGLNIPKGVIIQLPVWHIHHDPRHYPDPWKFDPDRFSPENKDLLNPCAFLPFGIGPRNCVGMKFALLEAKLAVARMVKSFHLQLSPRTDDPLILSCPTVITIPKNGVYVKVTPR